MKWGRLYEDDPPATLVLCRRGDSNLHELHLPGFPIRSATCPLQARAALTAGRAGEREERATDDTHQRL